ncbi:MAG: antitoxin MazE family protein [Desulfohalobiaceae bacterium]|nr:antitoxin MazE family protein [Desulfohalobiaceae bacterium]
MSAQLSKRVQKHRERLRAAGLRPVQIWVPDTRKKGFAEECRRQSLLVTDDPQEVAILEWIEKVSDTRGWE